LHEVPNVSGITRVDLFGTGAAFGRLAGGYRHVKQGPPAALQPNECPSKGGADP